jgi:hypothetical protein
VRDRDAMSKEPHGRVQSSQRNDMMPRCAGLQTEPYGAKCQDPNFRNKPRALNLHAYKIAQTERL